jgi:hypothetical protein
MRYKRAKRKREREGKKKIKKEGRELKPSGF